MVYISTQSPKMNRKQARKIDWMLKMGSRYSEPRKIYPWKDRKWGRDALCFIYIYCANHGSDDDFINKKPGSLKVAREGLYKFLLKWYPKVFDDYLSVTGKVLTDKVIMSRAGNMFRNNGNRSFGIGPEHPKNHPKLQKRLHEIEEFYKKELAKGR